MGLEKKEEKRRPVTGGLGGRDVFQRRAYIAREEK